MQQAGGAFDSERNYNLLKEVDACAACEGTHQHSLGDRRPLAHTSLKRHYEEGSTSQAEATKMFFTHIGAQKETKNSIGLLMDETV